MMKLVECIPNFSVSRERDEAAFNALVDTAKAVPGCTVLDVQSDGTHNRCVFTLVGSPEGIGEAAFRLAKRAMEVIDLTKHQGAHPPDGGHGRDPLCAHHGHDRAGVRGAVQAGGGAYLGRAANPQLPV